VTDPWRDPAGILASGPPSVLAEAGIGRIPMMLERMHHVFKVHRHCLGSPITELPSKTFRWPRCATFLEDHAKSRCGTRSAATI